MSLSAIINPPFFTYSIVKCFLICANIRIRPQSCPSHQCNPLRASPAGLPKDPVTVSRSEWAQERLERERLVWLVMEASFWDGNGSSRIHSLQTRSLLRYPFTNMSPVQIAVKRAKPYAVVSCIFSLFPAWRIVLAVVVACIVWGTRNSCTAIGARQVGYQQALDFCDTSPLRAFPLALVDRSTKLLTFFYEIGEIPSRALRALP